MASRTFAGSLALTGDWALHESGWKTGMDANLAKMSAIAQLSVISRTTGTPPGSPANGEMYIVPSSGTSGVWSGNENKVAVRDNGTWVYYTAATGWLAYVQSDGVFYRFASGQWVTLAQPVDVDNFFSGAPGSSAKVVRYVFTRAGSFPDDFSGSRASADTAATASTVFSIKKNGSTIGSITFGAGGSTGTFATTGSSAETFAAGDVLTVTAPASADATLADISINLAGTR